MEMITENDSENLEGSNERGTCTKICDLFREMKKFCVEKNIEQPEQIHEDSDKFNDAIKKANKEGNHDEIYKLLLGSSS